MGTTINFHVEVEIAGEWHHYAALYPRRDYWMFGLMAGVRGDETPLAMPRGLPTDATFLTRFSHGRSGHPTATSYLVGSEVVELVRRYELQYEYHPNRSMRFFESWAGTYLFGDAFEFPIEELPELTNVRFVFWFD